MKNRNWLLIVLFLSLAMPGAFAGFPVNSKSTTALSYEQKKAELMQYFAKHGRADNINANYLPGKKCMTSKIGRAMMIVGGGSFVGGIIWLSTAPKHGSFDFGPDGAFAMVFGGLLCVAAGGLIAIVGGIINRGNRYAFIAPKRNEVGIAYKF